MYEVETLEKDGYTLTIYVDDDPDSPRNWDNIGKLYIPRPPRGYMLSDKDASAEECAAAPLALPVYMLNHSGLAISTLDFNEPWDSWRAGYIYVTAETLKREYMDQGYTMEKALECARTRIQGEINVYNDYMQGAVYGYEIADAESEINSCWGYFGDTGLNDIKELFNSFVTRKKREKAEQARRDAIAAAPLFIWGKIDPVTLQAINA